MGIGKGTLLAVAAMSGMAALAGSASAATYTGNGATGFGGAIGNGTLSITESNGDISFSITPASDIANAGNKVVLYLDTKAGGFSSTATLTDEGDFGRKLVTGATTANGDAGGGPTRSTVNFPAGFGADIGISFSPNDYGPAFDLTVASGDNGPGTYHYVGGNGLGGTAPYTVTVSRSALGLGPTGGFSFVGSLLSYSLYRSNESFGANSAADNPGFNGPLTFTSALTYSVPEPATLGAIAGAGLVALRRRRR